MNAFEHFDSEFEMEVCELLRDKGYAVDTQAGCSSFKIDLALKHPHSSTICWQLSVTVPPTTLPKMHATEIACANAISGALDEG